jgi:Zn finger protein HypA/HybF involved in hydrogenase expression
MGRRDEDVRLPREGLEPDPDERTTMECRDCGARFPRSEVASPEKGTLACPDCDSTELTAVGS